MFSVDELSKFLETGGEWSSNLTCVPAVDENTIDSHFAASNRQLNRGWIFKEEKYIRRIECHACRGTGLLVVRSICLCSMKSGHYKQVAVLKADAPAAAVQAHCTCVAGLVQIFQRKDVTLYCNGSMRTTLDVFQLRAGATCYGV